MQPATTCLIYQQELAEFNGINVRYLWNVVIHMADKTFRVRYNTLYISRVCVYSVISLLLKLQSVSHTIV